MNTGKSIKLFLVDGTSSGLVTAEIGQWTGKATVVPRPKLDGFARRPDAHRPGVYVLVGPDPQRTDREMVYIGEGEDAFERLRDHIDRKEFWTRAVVFTSSDEQLTKAHIKYVESRLVEIGRAAGRSTLENANTPPRPGLPEADVSDMEQFLDHVQTLLPVVGVQFAQPIATRRVEASTAPVFELSAVGARATAREIDGEFVVARGSTARVKGVDSWTTGKAARDQLVENGVLELTENGKLYVFTDDQSFSSPSLAAAVVCTRNMNGRVSWKLVGTGQTYADWQDERLRQAEQEARQRDA
ncbi:MAG: GIY-YIG nuclease family protein [Planctomycetota bacterium]